MKKSIWYCLCALLLLASCSKAEEDVVSYDSSAIDVKCSETITLKNRGENISVENPFYASISGNSLKGLHVGTTRAVAENGANAFTINVMHSMDYIPAPSTNWGTALSAINPPSYSGYKVERAGDNMYLLIKNNKIHYVYSYIGENGKLKGASVLVPVSDASVLANWLREEYFLIPTGDKDIVLFGVNAASVEEATSSVSVAPYILNSHSTKYGYDFNTTLMYMVMFIP